ncbi:hypothetical protein SAMN06298216_3618 [Spirosomataceae bacterium TFI 002]|nr:hypothetical protein SAMN06298216_3618 [Spirosomataceae bacterium TFI 002]
MIKYFFKSSAQEGESVKLSINTHDIYAFLVENKEYLPKQLYLDGKRVIRDILVKYDSPEAKFNADNIEYFKGKYNQYIGRGLDKGESKPDLNFFCEPNNDFMPPSSMSKMAMANFAKTGEAFIDLKNPQNNAEGKYTKHELKNLEIHKWAYDIYSFWQSCSPPIEELLEEYELAVVLYLIFLDPFYFSQSHLCHLFNQSDFTNVENILNVLEMKHSDTLKLGNWKRRMKGFKASVENELKNEKVLIDNNEKVEVAKKSENTLGRKKSKIHYVSQPITRRKNDKLTSLSTRDSAILFRLLKESNLIIQDDQILSQTDLSKALACLVGYGDKATMAELSPKRQMERESLERIRKELSKLMSLISSKLAKLN